MSDSPTTWMPLDIGDYLADTMDLSAEYHGAYLLLIMHYWKTGISLKNDKKSLTNVSKISWKNTQEILSRFFHICDGAWHHKRIDKELAKAHNNKEKRQNQTAAATTARLAKTRDVTRDVTLNVTSLPAGTPLPSPKVKKEATQNASAGASEFQKIFDAGCAVNPALMTKSTAIIHQWLAEGITALDAVPEIQRIAAKARSWTFFTPAIMDAKATRETPLPKGQPHEKFSQIPTKLDRAKAAILRSAEAGGYAEPIAGSQAESRETAIDLLSNA